MIARSECLNVLKTNLNLGKDSSEVYKVLLHTKKKSDAFRLTSSRRLEFSGLL